MNSLLKKLKLEAVNAGACLGPQGWIRDPNGRQLVSYNPTTSEPIASVIQATSTTYDRVAQSAVDSFKAWREQPAPKRGLLIRDLAGLVREYKEPLGDLISLEMGKIRAEGHGEVQEMIDVCDFAVGLSRQLYGLTMQ
ncbi:MAG TPA: aldehyde dehydrogenase family protein, partial [Anaerolineales bacterium]|nr:aldehyde dehydrogenase family protein [Anaerolineales bacterium]